MVDPRHDSLAPSWTGEKTEVSSLPYMMSSSVVSGISLKVGSIQQNRR